ncbi:DUF6151 family protein [Sagittula sp. NFXS13]|uniref:DUF6151 family protein n=1 Tax=Sagittula sp. NFXS13 TaxID=2819095 RepID=UPI0032E027B1
MQSTQHISCSCHAMTWSLSDSAPGRHVVCYCTDCQSFARHLGHTEIFAPHNGTHIWQTVPEALQITGGLEHLRALRLSPKGLVRWYAGCCGTPIANTLAKPTVPFVGAILPAPGDGFGPVKGHVNTAITRGAVKERGLHAAGGTILLRAVGALLRQKTRGSFFDEAGRPVRDPQVLTVAERTAARDATA